MPYQLMVRSNRYIPIDIRRHSRFIINSNLKNGTSNLDEIDLFTTQFEDGTDLKLSLIKEDLLSPKLFDKEIAIRYKHGGYNTIKDSIIYRDIKAYLDKNNLEKTMRILSEDSVFISRLVDEYMPKDDNEQNKRPYINYNVLSKFNVVSSQYDINYLRDYIERFLSPYKRGIDYIRNMEWSSAGREELIKALITVFYYNEVYRRKKVDILKYDPNVMGYDYYLFDDKIQYRNLHDLALFVGNYDIARNKKEEEKEYQEEFLEPDEMVFDSRYTEPVSKTKTKKRIRKPLEGQLSFF